MKRYWLAIVLSCSLSDRVWARGMDDFEWGHELSIGGGISSPAATTALSENPAGLVYNHQFKILAQGASQSNAFNPLGLGGLLFLGNGMVGAGLGVQTFSDLGGTPGGIGLLDFGVAADVTSWNFAFGANGRYTLWNTGAPIGTGIGATWDVDAGILYNPRGDIRFGLTAFNVLSGVTAIGAGLAADPSSWATFTLDTAKDPRGSGWALAPALGVHLSSFQITYAYGLTLSPGSLWLRQGSSLGIGVNFGQLAHLELYYNHLALYYAGLMLKF